MNCIYIIGNTPHFELKSDALLAQDNKTADGKIVVTVGENACPHPRVVSTRYFDGTTMYFLTARGKALEYFEVRSAQRERKGCRITDRCISCGTCQSVCPQLVIEDAGAQMASLENGSVDYANVSMQEYTARFDVREDMYKLEMTTARTYAYSYVEGIPTNPFDTTGMKTYSAGGR